jgi:hypothetical protein
VLKNLGSHGKPRAPMHIFATKKNLKINARKKNRVSKKKPEKT